MLNKRGERLILNRWKQEGRIPENYCGPIQGIITQVEDEFRRENKISEFTRDDEGMITSFPVGWEKIRDELYRRDEPSRPL